MAAAAVREAENENKTSNHEFKECRQINSKGKNQKAQQTPTQPCRKGVLDIKDSPESARDWYRGSNVGHSAQAGTAALLLSGKHD